MERHRAFRLLDSYQDAYESLAKRYHDLSLAHEEQRKQLAQVQAAYAALLRKHPQGRSVFPTAYELPPSSPEAQAGSWGPRLPVLGVDGGVPGLGVAVSASNSTPRSSGNGKSSLGASGSGILALVSNGVGDAPLGCSSDGRRTTGEGEGPVHALVGSDEGGTAIGTQAALGGGRDESQDHGGVDAGGSRDGGVSGVANEPRTGKISVWFNFDPRNELRNRTLRCRNVWSDGGKVSFVNWSRCGAYLAVGCDGTIGVRRTKDGSVTTMLDGKTAVATASSSKSSKDYVVFQGRFTADDMSMVVGDTKGVTVWCVKSGKVRYQINGGPVFSVATRQSGHFASGSGDQIVILWSDTGRLVRSLGERLTPGVAVRSLSFDPSSNRLVSGNDDGWLRLWDLENRTLVTQIEAHKGAIGAVQYSKNGQSVLSGSTDGKVRVWDLRSRAATHTFEHYRAVQDVTYSQNGRWILSGAADCSAAFWDMRSGRASMKLGMHSSPVVGLAHNPHASTFAIAEEKGQVRVWSYDE